MKSGGAGALAMRASTAWSLCEGLLGDNKQLQTLLIGGKAFSLASRKVIDVKKEEKLRI